MVTAITNDLLRSCIQLDTGSTEKLEERKRLMPLNSVTQLVFSFKGLRAIDHLEGLQSLSKLYLDNNTINLIENLSHLQNLTVLDLSFNNIEKIEGLEALKNLDDLSLYCNKIKHLEGLEELQQLTSLSVGRNLLQSLDEVLYLRRLKNLRLLTLEGNPLCKEEDYRTYVIGHLRDLKFFDHRIVDEATLLVAREQYQDEMQEIKQKEADEELIVKTAEEKAAKQALFQEANLTLVDQLFDVMLLEDPEYAKLKEVPGLLEALDDYRQKSDANNEEVIGLTLELLAKKKEEIRIWKLAIKALLDKKDKESIAILNAFKKLKKKVFREVEKDPENRDAKLKELLEQNAKVKERLLEIEMQCVGEMQDSWSKFDDNYFQYVESCKQNYQNHFATMRMLENKFSESVIAKAVTVMDEFAISDSYDEIENEEARMLIHDKDLMNNCIQASHDAHTLKIDTTEDQTLHIEDDKRQAVYDEFLENEIKRNRERIEEILFVARKYEEEITSQFSDYLDDS